MSVSGFYPEEARVRCNSEVSIVEALIIAQYYVGMIAHFDCTTDESLFAYGAIKDNFTYHVQQSGETCASASGAMYLRELKQASSVSEAAVISTAESLGYNPLDGLTATESLNTINRYISDHLMELQYPYNAQLFSDPILSSDANAAAVYDIFLESLTEYHLGTCMFFASYPTVTEGPGGHVVYAIGVLRQVNIPNDFTGMTEMYLANPQYEAGSEDAITVFNQDNFKNWYCVSTLYDERIYDIRR